VVRGCLLSKVLVSDLWLLNYNRVLAGSKLLLLVEGGGRRGLYVI
jgi:hypothetical protein